MSESSPVDAGQPITSPVGFWPLTALAAVFVLLYLAALIGWLRPVSDLTMIARLEPILFLVFGYYFGRMPIRQAEHTARYENERIAKKLEAVIRQKEQARAEREAIEEKIRNAKVALRSELIDLGSERRLATSDKPVGLGPRAVETAINILNS